MSRTRWLLLPLLVLLLAACGGDGETADAPGATAGAGDLPEGVAATVGGSEIAAEDVERLADRTIEAVEDPGAGTATGAAPPREQVEASILSRLILNRIIVDGARAEGVEVDESEIEQTRQALVDAAGGEEAFAEQVDASGLDAAQVEREIESLALLEKVGRQLNEARAASAPGTSTGPTPPATGTRTGTADPLQGWIRERVRDADVEVAASYGTWQPDLAQVIPPSAGEPGAGTGTTS